MSAITPHYRSVNQLLQSQSFSIDEYQREYEWEKANIDELLSDLQAIFFRHYKPGGETPAVSGYGEYFPSSASAMKIATCSTAGSGRYQALFRPMALA